MKKKNILKLIFLLLIILIVCSIFKDSLSSIFNQIKDISFYGFISVLILSIMYSIIEGFNLSILAKQFNSKFKIINGILCYFYTSFYKTVTMGSGSYVFSIYYLQKNNICPSQGIDVSTLNYVLNKFSVLLFATICIFFNHEFIYEKYFNYITFISIVYVITILIVVSLIFLCISKKFHKLLINLLNKLIKRNKYIKQIKYIQSEISNIRNSSMVILRNKKVILFQIFMNLIKYLILYYISYIALREMNVAINIHQAITITSLVTILAGVIPTPAGIASIEFVYVLLFSIVTNSVNVVSAMLIYRFSSFIFPFLIGGIYVILDKIISITKVT